MKVKKSLGFPLLTNPDLTVMATFGVVNQKGRGNVPHPTVLIIDKAGLVRFIHLDEDYRQRPTPQQVLDVVVELSESSVDEAPLGGG